MANEPTDAHLYEVTKYPRLYDPPSGVGVFTWDELATWLDASRETTDKFSVAGFGAHVLRGSARRADLVERVTLFGFDVDAGTPPQVEESLRLLKAAGLRTVVYSSHSHCAVKPALRFLIAPSRPITPAEYPGLRRYLITQFKVPCKPEQSGDVSRFWFLPSHKPGATHHFESFGDHTFDVGAALATGIAVVPTAVLAANAAGAANTWVRPPDPEGAVDVGPLRAQLERRCRSLGARAPLMKLFLAGDVLAPDGERNETMFRVAGMVAYAVPQDTPLSVLMTLARPSLLAMQAQGSKLTEAKVERMFLTAMEKRARNSVGIEEFRRRLLGAKTELDTTLKARLTSNGVK